MILLTFVRRIGRHITGLIANVEEAQEMAREFDTLSHLTNEQLAERGLTRQDIPRFVWGHGAMA